MVFIESPCGVGFSYSDKQEENPNDEITSEVLFYNEFNISLIIGFSYTFPKYYLYIRAMEATICRLSPRRLLTKTPPEVTQNLISKDLQWYSFFFFFRFSINIGLFNPYFLIY
jgi:hypothetical protein